MHSVQIFIAFMNTDRALPLSAPHIIKATAKTAIAILTPRITHLFSSVIFIFYIIAG